MKDILKILNAGLDTVNGEKAVLENLKLEKDLLEIRNKTFDLKKFSNIYVIGIGKVSPQMARGTERILGNRITYGLVVTKKKNGKLKKIKQLIGSHPVPDNKSLFAGKAILKLARKAKENDLVIVLLSGGASALIVSPKGVSLKEKQALTKQLLACGADIKEINTIRKHLSDIKGGNLAKAIYPATCLTLIISDVLGNDLSVIGSGPTYPDGSTFRDCLKIFNKYHLKKKVPKIYKYFLKNLKSKKNETLKPGDKALKKVSNFIIADLDLALREAKEEAENLGYRSSIIKRKITGIASKEGEKLAKNLKKINNKSCIVSGGETTVILTGNGKGGRNLELTIGFLLKTTVEGQTFDSMKGIKFLSAGTDGDDGTSGVAGALVSDKELKKAHNLNLDFDQFLRDNNSLEFFKKIDGILKFPQTTNVGDIQILLKK